MSMIGVHTHKILENPYANRIFFIFLDKWLSIREASMEYDLEQDKEIPYLGKKKKYKINRTVYKYFNLFKNKKWLETRIVTKEFRRKSKTGLWHFYTSTRRRSMINLCKVIIDYLDSIPHLKINSLDKHDKVLLKTFFSMESIRRYLIDQFFLSRVKKNIISFLEKIITLTIFLQLYNLEHKDFKIYNKLKILESQKELNKIDKIIDNISDIRRKFGILSKFSGLYIVADIIRTSYLDPYLTEILDLTELKLKSK